MPSLRGSGNRVPQGLGVRVSPYPHKLDRLDLYCIEIAHIGVIGAAGAESKLEAAVRDEVEHGGVFRDADRFFSIDLAHRLCAVFPDARLGEIPGGRTFFPLDEPQRVAHEIQAAVQSR